jgi:hypothetical protein
MNMGAFPAGTVGLFVSRHKIPIRTQASDEHAAGDDQFTRDGFTGKDLFDGVRTPTFNFYMTLSFSVSVSTLGWVKLSR